MVVTVVVGVAFVESGGVMVAVEAIVAEREIEDGFQEFRRPCSIWRRKTLKWVTPFSRNVKAQSTGIGKGVATVGHSWC
ncbi:hypothetical protein L2E82_38216 [Cichorium intybus]|uniref:Uncharacterized protein n=1 Tax=Cichorium intybus TaxID=13427 RepID=A0ACB9AK10_CICIN|nr:hypothetical protein L2E82_38216 [Cichorium intybus]